MRILYLTILLFCVKALNAHQPDISSIMIYEQNGKSILLIKSSLTAFEAEVHYIFGEDAYKTPEEFNQLVTQLFQQHCFVIANKDTIQFANIQVQLGHETNLFAELDNLPKTIKSLKIRNALFKDMHNNRCELILTLNGLPQKQYIFDNSNNHEVNLEADNGKWVIASTNKAFYLNPGFLSLLAVIVIIILVVAVPRGKSRHATEQKQS